MSMRTSSWTNSGLPSDVARIRSRSAPASGRRSELPGHELLGRLGAERLEQERAGVGSRADERRRRSSSSGRAVQTSRSGTPRVHAPRYSMQVEQRLLGPVHVVHDGQQRAAARERLEQLADRPERLLDGDGRSREAECRPDPLEDLGGVRRRPSSSAATSPLAISCDARAGQACRLAHGLCDRRERDAFAVREAVADEHLPLALDVLRQLADQPRLAGPGRRDHGGDADVALFTGAPPELEELRELALAPDQRRMRDSA